MLKTIRALSLAVALAGGAAPALAQQAATPLASSPAAPRPAAPQIEKTVTPTGQAGLQAAQLAKPADIPHFAPTPGIGQPTDAIALQPQETAIGTEAAWFHNTILVPMMALISFLVLVLLVWVVIRYRAAANPVPSRTSHNTAIEVIWTLLPVLILVLIAVPSIRLLAHQYSPPKADLTVKVVGNQWYWSYQYPDNGDFEVVSNMLKEPGQVTGKERARTAADGPRLLAVDERMVVPAGAVVKLITTSADVIHSFALPAAWVKMDAVPGRLNETWFKIDRPGVYFGQCSELCGARHGFMPIAVEVVPPARFAQWVAFKGGTMPGAKPVPSGAEGPAANPDATSPSSPATAGAAGQPPLATAPTDGASAPATGTSQGATGNQGPQ